MISFTARDIRSTLRHTRDENGRAPFKWAQCRLSTIADPHNRTAGLRLLACVAPRCAVVRIHDSRETARHGGVWPARGGSQHKLFHHHRASSGRLNKCNKTGNLLFMYHYFLFSCRQSLHSMPRVIYCLDIIRLHAFIFTSRGSHHTKKPSPPNASNPAFF